MGRDEHFDEIVLFDGFFLSLIIYFIAGRLGYVLTHFGELGTLYRTLAILAYPGINTVIGMIASGIFLYLFARAQEWQVWKVADSFVVTLSLILLFGGVGSILNGTHPVWQVNVWGSVWALLTFVIVSRVRKNFRFYSWYKGESSTAQDGLASLMFILSVGIYYFIVSFFDQLGWKFWVIPGESLVGLLFVSVSIYLIKERVGRRESTLWGKLSNIIRRK